MTSHNKVVLRGSTRSFAKDLWESRDQLVYLMLNFPYRCNYHCLKCCNVLDKKPLTPQPKGFSAGWTGKIIHDASSQRVRVLVIAGEGEPLLDPAFRRVVREASDSGVIPYVFTNGSVLDSDSAGFLSTHRASLIVSLDSLSPTRYAQLTGGGRLDRVLRNLEYCRRAYEDLIEESGNTRLVSLAINTVVTSLNVGEVEPMRRFCGDDVAFVCNRPTMAGLAEENWRLLYGDVATNSEVDSITDRMASECGPLGSTPDGKWCAYMKHGVSIGPDGSVLTCAYSLETAGCYGKISGRSFEETNREVMETVEEFYRLCGHSRCILRHPQYKDFVSFLRQKAPGAKTVSR